MFHDEGKELCQSLASKRNLSEEHSEIILLYNSFLMFIWIKCMHQVMGFW